MNSAIIAFLNEGTPGARTSYITGGFGESVKQVKLMEELSPTAGIFRIFEDGETVEKIEDMTKDDFFNIYGDYDE